MSNNLDLDQDRHFNSKVLRMAMFAKHSASELINKVMLNTENYISTSSGQCSTLKFPYLSFLKESIHYKHLPEMIQMRAHNGYAFLEK